MDKNFITKIWNLRVAVIVNVIIWIISIIALIIIVGRFPGAKGMFPILAAGLGIGLILLSSIKKQ